MLVNNPIAFKYTSVWTRLFRTDADPPFIMTSSNRLLKTMRGCDGLKTGFFYAAGFSIAATAAKENQRAIAVVIGAESQKVRDTKAKKLLTNGLSELVEKTPPPKPSHSSSYTPAR